VVCDEFSISFYYVVNGEGEPFTAPNFNRKYGHRVEEETLRSSVSVRETTSEVVPKVETGSSNSEFALSRNVVQKIECCRSMKELVSRNSSFDSKEIDIFNRVTDFFIGHLVVASIGE